MLIGTLTSGCEFFCVSGIGNMNILLSVMVSGRNSIRKCDVFVQRSESCLHKISSSNWLSYLTIYHEIKGIAIIECRISCTIFIPLECVASSKIFHDIEHTHTQIWCRHLVLGTLCAFYLSIRGNDNEEKKGFQNPLTYPITLFIQEHKDIDSPNKHRDIVQKFAENRPTPIAFASWQKKECEFANIRNSVAIANLFIFTISTIVTASVTANVWWFFVSFNQREKKTSDQKQRNSSTIVQINCARVKFLFSENSFQLAILKRKKNTSLLLVLGRSSLDA